MVTWEFPLAFLTIVSIFDLYLLTRSSPSVYQLSLLLFYGYMAFLTISFSQYVTYNVVNIDMTSYKCLQSAHWRVQCQLFPLLLENLSESLLFQCLFHLTWHLIFVQAYLNRLFWLAFPRVAYRLSKFTYAVLAANLAVLWIYSFDVDTIFEAVGLFDIDQIDQAFADVIRLKI